MLKADQNKLSAPKNIQLLSKNYGKSINLLKDAKTLNKLLSFL